MNKKIIIVALAALSSLQFIPDLQATSFKLKQEQPEDFSFYQAYNWDSPVTRKALYDAIFNGQDHMMTKMRTCMSETDEWLEGWLVAFKGGQKKVLDHMSVRGLLDMDDNEIRYPLDGDNVADWLTKDFAQQHYQAYTGLNLRQLQDKYWGYCLAKLPVELFTQEGVRRAQAWGLSNPVYR